MPFNFAARHPLVWCYLLFLYFSVVPHLLIYADGMSGSVGLRQSLMMSGLWLIPLLLWPAHTRVLAAGISIALWVGGITSLGYWLVFGQEFSQSVIFIIFESNFAEGSEFLESYFRVSYLLAFAAFSLFPLLMWRAVKPVRATPPYRYGLAVFLGLLTCWPLLATTLVHRGSLAAGKYDLLHSLEPAAPWNLVVGYLKYTDQLTAMEQNLASIATLPPLQNLAELDVEEQKTLVRVIGESTNRQRMSLYGYGRRTTPKLDALQSRGELFAFTDVVSPRSYTIEALQQVLTFANADNASAYLDQPGLLSMMKQAGYDITWITNQQTQTRRNTMLTTLSQLADHQVYLNNNANQNASQYDGKVLEPFARSLQSSKPKKMIVVHLLGTHRGYHYRYPPQFNRFTSADGAPVWIDDSILEQYNSYDNAVLYNDFVVSELIELLGRQHEESILVYLSDHGEEVYDDQAMLFCGRNEGKPTPAMFTVPFIVWTNDHFAALHDPQRLRASLHRPYSSADFIYTWSDLVGLQYAGMDASRSILSNEYVSRNRWIGDPELPRTLQDYSSIAGAVAATGVPQLPKEAAMDCCSLALPVAPGPGSQAAAAGG